MSPPGAARSPQRAPSTAAAPRLPPNERCSSPAPRRSCRKETAPAAQTAATTASPTGRVRPASDARIPAVTQRPVSTAYSDQAASAVNRDSLYAIDWTTPTGSTAQSSTAQTPARGPCTWSATAKIPHAAASEASAATTKPPSAYDSGDTAATSRSSQGSRGKKARFECTSPFARRTS
ncbi:hypothetical protein SHIRM173S_11646 [Streptomyces hirsutus]